MIEIVPQTKHFNLNQYPRKIKIQSKMCEASTISFPTLINTNEETTPNSMCRNCPLVNSFKLFVLFEKERLRELKELYHNKPVQMTRKNHEGKVSHLSEQIGVVLPTFPPRYQNLDLPVDLLKPNAKTLSQGSPKNMWREWESLDRASKSFLQDVSNILRARYNEIAPQSQHCPPLKHTAVTPPTSPLRRDHAKRPITPEHFLSLQDDMQTPSHYEDDSIGEVDMSDEEIALIWRKA